jgi:hypothetical protein
MTSFGVPGIPAVGSIKWWIVLLVSLFSGDDVSYGNQDVKD